MKEKHCPERVSVRVRMKITAELLLYIAENRGIIGIQQDSEQGKSDSCSREIRRIRLRKTGALHQSDAFSCEEWTLIIAHTDCDKEPENFGKETIEEEKHSDQGQKQTVVFISPSIRVRGASALAPEELLEAFWEIFGEVQRWSEELSIGILKQVSETELFQKISHWIQRDYAIVDLDMNIIFSTEGYKKSRNIDDNNRLPDSVFQDLVSHKKFHDAALEKGIFYYYTDSVDTTSLCRNIFANEQYIARVVLNLLPEEERLPVGAEDLFTVYTDFVQELFLHRNLFPTRHPNDAMHNLCRAILSGEQLEEGLLERVLEKYNWNRRDRYSAILLRFNTEEGWNAPLYMILPFLSAKLEREWSHTCAVGVKSEIFLVTNHSLDAEGLDAHAFLQRIAYFVRDNICKAGVSPVFMDFSLLKYAKQTAEEALRLGTVADPHLWYYLFDDFRLSHTVEMMKKQMPSELLIHPAIGILMQYDAQHQSELARTLRVYLESNLNMTLAAEKLYIHRTSFCRRMNQIRKLTGVNLDEPDTVLTLLLSYRLLP